MIQRGCSILLVGDTHPEMLAIAKSLVLHQLDFKIALPTYFTAEESRFFPKYVTKALGLDIWLSKRTLDPGFKSNLLIREYAYLEALAWLLKKFGYYRISWRISLAYQRLRSKALPKLVKLYRPRMIISYDTIHIPRFEGIGHIVICPMSHPESVAKSLAQAREMFPDWPEMEDEKPLGVSETARSADRLVTLSSFAKKTYLAQGFEESKIEVIHIGPINSKSEISPQLDFTDGIVRILFLGRMTRVKGVEALARLSNSLDPTRFQITLTGQCPPNIASYIRQISNAEVLKLFENPSPDQISFHFLSSNVFALPSFNEGFNISSLEAMTYGLIPILSKNAGVSEVLVGTQLERLIINPGDIEQLSSCLHYLADLDQQEFKNLSNISIQLSKSFSFDRFAESFLSILKKQLNL